MPTAVAADGTSHVFPEGTADAVIDRVMAEYAQNASLRGGAYSGQMQRQASARRQGGAGAALSEAGQGLSAFTSGIPFFQDVAAGVGTALDPRLYRGQLSVPESYKANREALRASTEDIQNRRPLAATALQTAGVGTSLLAPGGAGAQLTARAPQAVSTAGRTANVLSNMGRGAVSAGTGGAIYGLGSDGTAQQRLSQGVSGARNSALLGAALSGIATTIAQSVKNKAAIRSTPSTADLKTTSQDLYTQAENAGVIIRGSSIGQFAKDLTRDMTHEGITPALHPNAFDSLKRINDLKGNLTLKGAEQERRILQNRVADAAASASRTGQKDDLRIARMVVDKYDDFIENLHPQSTVAGTSSAPAVELLKDARKVYATKAKGETIQTIIDKARQNSNITTFEQELRKGFRKLANNDRGIGRFAQEERDAIRNVANGTLARNTLSTLGRLSPSMTASGGVVGAGEALAALTGHVGPVLKALAVGVPAKVASTMATSNAANLASAMARGARPGRATVPAARIGAASAVATRPQTKREDQ